MVFLVWIRKSTCGNKAWRITSNKIFVLHMWIPHVGFFYVNKHFNMLKMKQSQMWTGHFHHKTLTFLTCEGKCTHWRTFNDMDIFTCGLEFPYVETKHDIWNHIKFAPAHVNTTFLHIYTRGDYFFPLTKILTCENKMMSELDYIHSWLEENFHIIDVNLLSAHRKHQNTVFKFSLSSPKAKLQE